MSIVGYDFFGRNNYSSLSAETKTFNASTLPHPGVWDAATQTVTYDSTKTYQAKTPLFATGYKRGNNSAEKGSARRPTTGYWYSQSGKQACYVTANAINATPPIGWEVHIWLKPTSYETSDCNIVIPFHLGNVSLSSIPFRAIADAIYNNPANVINKSMTYQPPQSVNCYSVGGWLGQVVKDSMGNCKCDTNSVKLTGGDIAIAKGGKSFTIPAGEQWCIKKANCSNKQHKEINEYSHSYECRDISGCMDEWNTNYNPNAAIHYANQCGGVTEENCKTGYHKTIGPSNSSDGSCRKIITSHADKLYLVESKLHNKWSVIFNTPTGAGSNSFNTKALAQSKYNELKAQYGCKDSAATNYGDVLVLYEDGSCEYAEGKCGDNDDCSSGYECISGSCVEYAEGKCGDNDDCSSGYGCVSGSCVATDKDIDLSKYAPYIGAAFLGLVVIVVISKS